MNVVVTDAFVNGSGLFFLACLTTFGAIIFLVAVISYFLNNELGWTIFNAVGLVVCVAVAIWGFTTHADNERADYEELAVQLTDQGFSQMDVHYQYRTMVAVKDAELVSCEFEEVEGGMRTFTYTCGKVDQ